jgi:hypothetical protein
MIECYESAPLGNRLRGSRLSGTDSDCGPSSDLGKASFNICFMLYEN